MYFPNIQNFAEAIESYEFERRNSLELIQLIPMVLFSNKILFVMRGGRAEDDGPKRRTKMTKGATWRTRTGTNRHPRTFIIIQKSSFDIKLKIKNSLLQKTKKVKKRFKRKFKISIFFNCLQLKLIIPWKFSKNCNFSKFGVFPKSGIFPKFGFFNKTMASRLTEYW